MITSYKQKAKIAGGICTVALVGPIVLGRVLASTGHMSDTGTFMGEHHRVLVDSMIRLPSWCRYFTEWGRT